MLDFSTQQTIAPLGPSKKLGNIQFSGYLKSHPSTAHLLFSIQKYLEPHPVFYINSLLSQFKGLDLQTIKSGLQIEYKALLQGRSFFHIMNNGIQSRKRCINKIRRDITKSSKFVTLFPQEYFSETEQDAVYIDWVQTQGYSVVDVEESAQESIEAISNIFADLSRLREMTIYLVEQIHQWRVKIQEHLDRCQQHSQIKYLYDDKSVYETFLQDSSFIWTSRLSNYIWMQAKQDPFVIRNVILVEQRKTKTLLQKYFLEIVYPKSEETVDKAVRCMEMLVYKYKPKLFNRFQEEELLIENYLKMEMNQHQFDQPEGGIVLSKVERKSPQSKEKSRVSPKGEKDKEVEGSPYGQNKLSQRGWVFQKQLRKTHRDRINDIVESHKNKMGMLKPYNISNYGQKNSIALAYLSDVKKNSRKERDERIRRHSVHSDKEQRQFMSEGEERKEKQNERAIESQPERVERRGMSESKMFRSLTKLSPIIYQDPKQEMPDTPKGQGKQQFPNSDSRIFGQRQYGKQPSLQKIKINSFALQDEEQQTKIEVDQEETPLNLNQFYEVFRADTNKPRKGKDHQEFVKNKDQNTIQNQKLVSIKKFIQKLRKDRVQRAKSVQHLPNTPYTKKPIRISLKKKIMSKQKSLSKSRSLQKSTDSYKDFAKITVQHKDQLPKDSKQLKKMFLALKVKSIPIDLVPAYVKHLESKRPVKSKIFSNFDTNELVRKLVDPFVHSIIFDIQTDQQVTVGTIVLSETLGGRGGKLKYLMEFMSVQPFQLVSVAILRVAEELLSTTPCQQVVYPLMVDRLDPVSSHFIDIIDSDLLQGIQKFGRMVIMQKPIPSLKGSDVRQRIYVFTSESNFKREKDLKLKMMGNYRSLTFECKCIVLTSNFRLRSQNLSKNTLHKYDKISLGELFARAIMRFMTKYHLKQLREASFGGSGELVQLVRTDPFLRSVLAATANDMKTASEDLLKTTNFPTMEDLIHYLKYKRHDEYFQLDFLAESRFILRHQLTLIELDQEISLEFTLTSTDSLYLLHNHKHHQLTQLNCSKWDTPAYLLPTTHQKLQLFFMSAQHFTIQTTDKIDLFSYLSIYFRNLRSQIYLNDTPSIVIPNLSQQRHRTSKVRMFDGFFKLFPQRQFYSAAKANCVNHWESYYSDAVIHQPVERSIVLEYPFIMGFYDKEHKILLSAFLFSNQDPHSP